MSVCRNMSKLLLILNSSLSSHQDFRTREEALRYKAEMDRQTAEEMREGSQSHYVRYKLIISCSLVAQLLQIKSFAIKAAGQ